MKHIENACMWLFALVFMILCTPLGWIGMIAAALAYKIISGF